MQCYFEIYLNRAMRKYLILIFINLFHISGICAQRLITGKVIDGTLNEPAIGASVLVEGTDLGTITDIDGLFSLSVPDDASFLLVSMVGYKTERVSVHRTDNVKVLLSEDVQLMDEVVVTGYGTARKRDVTGAIVSVDGEAIKSVPTNDVVSSLQGKIPGLMVVNTGEAGGTPNVKIRGVGTLNASSNPLYVVDGLLCNDIKFLNTTDVESIEVLKDPSSLAIFGVQGANGVIIITTKRSKEERAVVNYDGYAGFQIVFRRDRVALTNADEFTMLYNEMLTNLDPNAASWVPGMLGYGTDWQSKVLREHAFITNHNVSVSLSGKKFNSLLAFNYFNQDGVLKYNNYSRFNIRLNADYQVCKYLKIGANLNLSQMNTKPASANIQNAILTVPTYEPFAPSCDWNESNPGSYYHPSADVQNNVGSPVATMELYKDANRYKDYRALGNLFVEVSFLKDFTFRATGYMDLVFYTGSQYTPQYNVNNAYSASAQRENKTAIYRKSDQDRTFQGDLLLTYKKHLDEHRVEAMVGYTARKVQREGFWSKADSIADGMPVVPEDLQMLSMGNPNTISASDWWQEEAFLSALARISYSFRDRYLLTATFRADGSSKFSPSHRWGFFPSVGAGWVMSEENFMQDVKDYIDFFKWRVSWGQLGNDKIGNYLYYPTISPKGKQVVIAGETVFIPTVAYEVDENIHWEVMSGVDAGVSMQLFKNRLSAELGYYYKITRDLLAYVKPSSSLGAGYAITNAGSICNQGFEFTVGWRDKRGPFTYGIHFNGSTLNNKVLALGDNNADIISDDYHRTAVGQPIGSYYGYVQDGIFQNQEEVDSYCEMTYIARPGDIRYKDLNNDNKIDDQDRTFIGSALPVFNYGFNLNFGWNGLELAVDFNGVYGNQILDLKKTVAYTNVNYYTKSLGRWHGEGTSTTEPILDKSRGHNYWSSTNLLEDGSYLRMRNITLSYTIPERILNRQQTKIIHNFRVFVSGENVVTWKHNSGFTPEIYGSTLTPGADTGATYPIPSVFHGGLSITF